MSVRASLPPRSGEWAAAYNLISDTTPDSILEICHAMEEEIGRHDNLEDRGAINHLVNLMDNLYDEYTDEQDPRHGKIFIKEYKQQEFADLYRQFEKRLKSLEELEQKIIFYLEKSINKTTAADIQIQDIWPYLLNKMNDLRHQRAKFLYLFQSITFTPYNRIYRDGLNVLLSKIRCLGHYLNTTPKQTLALSSFVVITGYSIYTNTHTSFLVKAIPALFFMYVGYIFANIIKSKETAEPPTFSFTISPANSPIKR